MEEGGAKYVELMHENDTNNRQTTTVRKGQENAYRFIL